MLTTTPRTRLGPWGVSRFPDGPFTGKTESVELIFDGADLLIFERHGERAEVRIPTVTLSLSTVNLTITLPERTT